MNGIAGPGDLPGAEVGLTALLIKIGEQQAEQQSNYARNDDDTGGDRIHEARKASHGGLFCEDLFYEDLFYEDLASTLGEADYECFHTQGCEHNRI